MGSGVESCRKSGGLAVDLKSVRRGNLYGNAHVTVDHEATRPLRPTHIVPPFLSLPVKWFSSRRPRGFSAELMQQKVQICLLCLPSQVSKTRTKRNPISRGICTSIEPNQRTRIIYPQCTQNQRNPKSRRNSAYPFTRLPLRSRRQLRSVAKPITSMCHQARRARCGLRALLLRGHGRRATVLHWVICPGARLRLL